ncbi:polyprenyl synthetase family protein [Salinibacterium hongtaonis]|uniref:Geranylgeranyl pyrophosphate synthase n=1 Tax=Homoserinimonas hongtaonis TaxID=2079791 RepID=A0A2U1SY53_9MICO|nr:polyprenyl synthetase family protein [Salinibacterium hongtaonis]PWB96557.1 geranylgeranyl pyrophosphate synthase [Salinibacterium hongtaonis]
MTESKRIVARVQSAIDKFLAEQRTHLTEISPDLAPFVDYSASLLSGGKRFRAQFCYWGYRAVAPGNDDEPEVEGVVAASASLELFHAAALVHDDLIDNSDTRRGKPASHRRFQSLHTETGWTGNAESFGRSSAILLGDLLLGWSDEVLDAGLGLVRSRDSAIAARREFNRMRTEVTGGQYLDLLEEHSWRSRNDTEQLERAHRVIVYKSAKYSIEAPLIIGATIGGASLTQISALRDFGLPLGVAFQLRDDLLGVFGDPEQTGKPSGDDLREGKRTVLIGLARRRLTPSATRLLDELLGDPDLTDGQVHTLQASLRECGAVADVENLIAHNARKALAALEVASFDAAARAQLVDLVHIVTRRTV